MILLALALTVTDSLKGGDTISYTPLIYLILLERVNLMAVILLGVILLAFSLTVSPLYVYTREMARRDSMIEAVKEA